MRDQYSQNIAIASGQFEHEKAYWLEKLSGDVTIGQYPPDLIRAKGTESQMQTWEFVFPEEVFNRFRKLSNQSAYAVYMILLTGINYLLYRYSGVKDVVVGTPVFKASYEPEALNHVLAMRSRLETTLSFKQTLLQTKETVSEAGKHQNYPFYELMRLLEIPVTENRFPISNVMMLLENIQNPDYLREEQYDLLFAFQLTTGELKGSLHYDSNVFRAETIKQVIRHLLRFFAQVTENPDLPLADIDLLDTAEISQIVHEFNATKADFPQEKTIHLLFEEQVERTPEKTAVVDATQCLTYRELNQRANQIAWMIRAKGVKVNDVVGILMGQSVEMFVGLLAILKAGAAYMPIDPHYPAERVQYLLKDSGARILLTESQYQPDLEALELETMSLDDPETYAGSVTNPEPVNTLSDLAYVIYTSGSTGQPKGVMIEHQALLNRVCWFNQQFGVTSADRSSKYAGFAFDASVLEIYPYLIVGAEVHVVDEARRLDLEGLNTFFEEKQITVCFLPTQICEQFMALENQSLRCVWTGGDVLKSFTPRKYNLFNAYGPTEATVISTIHPVQEKSMPIPIGKPIANTQVYILNTEGNLQPVGAYGELCISGAGLGRGYLQNEAFTNEKYIPNPFIPGERMYRSGDLARWRHDGTLEFAGRIDSQVKIRGYRIELGEIEYQLLALDAIRDAVVVAHQDTDGLPALMAILVAEVEIPVAELRASLAQQLPEYMIPAYFIYLPELPLTPNGKVDRKRLPTLDLLLRSEKRYVAPQNPVEEKLVHIWQDVFGIEKIGVMDHFLELGGHSLKAIQIVTRIRQEFAVDISIITLFKEPTIAAVAKVIHSGQPTTELAISRVPVQEVYEVSYSQRRMWMLDQLEPGNPAQNLMAIHMVEGSIDYAALKKACVALIQRHESLRTTFAVVAGEPVQKVHPEIPFELEIVKTGEIAQTEEIGQAQREEQIRTQIWREALKPFDLTQGPLFRVIVFHLAADQQVMLFVMHHIISDGWSLDVFKHELTVLYQAYLQGELLALAPLPVQYKDFACWHNELIRSGALKADQEYWHQQLHGHLTPLHLPYDFPYRNLIADHQGESYRCYLSPECKNQLNQIAIAHQASLFMVLLAGFSAFLSRLTSETDIVIAGPAAGREHADLKGLIGFFLNTVIYRVQVNSAASFPELLQQVRETTLQVLNHQSYPYELLVQELGLETRLDEPAITSIFFNMLNFETSGQGDIKSLQPVYSELGAIMKFDLGFYITEYSNTLEFECHYRTGLFRRETIAYLLGEYMRLLETISANPRQFIHELTFLMPQSLTPAGHPGGQKQEEEVLEIQQSIVTRFETIVARYPDKLAVKTRDQELTYRQLNQNANGVGALVLEKCNPAFRLSVAEKTRYTRQMLLDGWGLDGQEKLKSMTVFVGGAGGSGSPVITQLALLGVGTIRIADPDSVDLSNLNRQFLHDGTRIGLNKAESARLTVERINPFTKVVAIPEAITRENVAEIVGDATLIFDNIDELEAKFILSEYAVENGIPHMISSMIDLNGYAALFHTPHTPCFHCLYDRNRLQAMLELKQLVKGYHKMPNPVASPSLFVSTGFVVNEALKIMLGFDNPAYNRFFFFNQKASKDLVNTNGYLAITYPFSEHFRRICREQGFDWEEGWRGKYLEELEIWPDPNCPVCSGYAQKHKPELPLCNPPKQSMEQVEVETVALLFEQGADMLVGILGALKAGKIYVPLDPTYPEDRLLAILQDSGAVLVITNEQNLQLAQRLARRLEQTIKVVDITGISGTDNLNLPLQPEHPAYILYTSGSTGKPKGVFQSHRNVLHFIRAYTRNLGITADDKLTLFSSYAFDAAVMDIFGALLTGATVYPYNMKEAGNLAALSGWLAEERITIYHSIPTLFRYLLNGFTGEDVFPALRYLVLGGEAVQVRDVEQYRRHFAQNVILVNGLGPTESTVTLQKFIDHTTLLRHSTVPVGYPVEETEVYLLDDNGNEVPVYGVGEIVVKSPYLALGYWNLPELTSNVFRPDPRTGEGRVYYSGDLGRRLPDGQIEFAGRKDTQVKIRGYRIEISEIETVLDQLSGVQKSVVVKWQETNGENALAAFYVTDSGQEVNPEHLRDTLQTRLPEYMLPARLIPLKELPVTPTGKIDRKALADRLVGQSVENVYEAPLTGAEQTMAQIWSDVLGVQKIGVTDNFFQLGGHSLKAIALITQIAKVFQVELPLSSIFKHPTIRELLTVVSITEEQHYTAIQRVSDQEYYPVSSAQKRMYVLHQLEGATARYNMPGVIALEGDVDPEEFMSIFRKLIQRHESLRTSFDFIEGHPVQSVHQDVPLEMELYETADESIREVIERFIRPFDLSQAPLVRIGFIHAAGKNYLLYDLHHIISDGTSNLIMANELIRLYRGEELPPLPIQYKDFANWQNTFLQSEVMQEQEAYWLEQFQGELPVLHLPTDYPRPAVMSFEGERLYFTLDKELTDQLSVLTRSAGATLYMGLLAVYNVLLARLSGDQDIIVGSPVAGRQHADLENLIGMFVNTLAMRNQPAMEKTFHTFLAEVKENALRAFENQDYQFEMLVDQLQLQRDLSRHPLFDTMFVLQNMANPSLTTAKGEMSSTDFQFNLTRFDLTLTAYETTEGLGLILEYSTRLFKRDTVERMTGYFHNILRTVVQTPDVQIGQIQLLTAADLEQILVDFNSTRREFPALAGLHVLLENSAQATPDNPAVSFGAETWTYADLNRRANHLARVLRTKGVRPDEIVGLMVERSLKTILGMFAILKAGGAYLPLDPAYPEERLRYMLHDSNVRILLTEKDFAEKIQFTGEVVEVEAMDLDGEEGCNLSVLNTPTNLAYVIYTSGSTGKPKGVMVEHRSISNNVQWNMAVCKLQQTDRFLQLFSVSFDGFALGLYTTLGSGAELVLCSGDELKDPLAIKRLVVQKQVTVLHAVPSLYSALLDCAAVEDLATLHLVCFGGESINPKMVIQSNALNPGICLVNEYGPTESSVVATRFTGITADHPNIIGKPIDNTTILILDTTGQPCPIGVAGELCISGMGLARGYLNRPELTQEKFTANPYRPGELMYRTGDLARWLPDGQIEFLGRMDYQVKIRGYRIELGEIEKHLQACPGVREAVVLDQKDSAGSSYLAAYIVGAEGLAIAHLREELARDLPQFMIPQSFLLLDALPLTPHGKIDRRTLAGLETQFDSGTDYVPPKTKTEERLTTLWSEVLGVPRVGVKDNFFTLGGHSLKATALAARIYREFQVELPLRLIYQAPTVEALAQAIQQSERKAYYAIPTAGQREYYPLSSAQRRLFILAGREANTVYNMPGVLLIPGRLEHERLQRTLQKLIQHHASFRTSFAIVEGEIVQRVQPEVEFEVGQLEIPGEAISANLTEQETIRRIVQELIQPFDLEKAPLFRVTAANMGDSTLLIYDMHHIIADGISMEILISDFQKLYAGEELPPLPLQYVDFAVWQEEYLRTEEMQREEAYWLSRFADEIPVLELSTDDPRPAQIDYAGERVSLTLTEEISGQLQDLAIGEESSLYMVLLALYNILLAKYSGQEDIAIGSPISGRQHPDVERIIGMFVNTLVMRNQPTGMKTFREFLAGVRENCLQAYEHQNYPFETLVDKLHAARDLSRNPLFDVLFTLQNTNLSANTNRSDAIKPYLVDNPIAKFDLSLQALETGAGLCFVLEYRVKLFRQATMQRFLQHLNYLIQLVVANPDIQIADIDLLLPSEREQLLWELNRTQTDYPREKTVAELIAEQTRVTPDRVALVYEDCQLTYRELNSRANQLARLLRERGVRADQVVGIVADRSPAMLVGIVAIVKAGGAYLPIDLDYPEERVHFMLEDAGVQILITARELTLTFAGEIIQCSAEQIYQDYDPTDVELVNQPEDLIYIIYTSGSTGKPKGVMIEHRNVTCRMLNSTLLTVTPDDRVLQAGSLAFDTSTFEIWSTLLNGATLYLVQKEYLLTADRFADILQKYQITSIVLTATLFNQLLDDNPNVFTGLRKLMVGGEVASPRHFNLVLDREEGLQLYNVYGPTEITMIATAHRVERKYEGSIPIGKPLSNTHVYILDPYGRLALPGVVGELCIGGGAVARGYWKRPELTAEKFITSPFVAGETIYRTGDLAKWLPDGTLDFVGRVDDQIKIRGYRVEIGEIETHLRSHPGVVEAVVLVKTDQAGHSYLCAYLVTERDISPAELRNGLIKHLPDYMIPKFYIPLDRFPVNAIGKLDRNALPEPDGSLSSTGEYVPPTNETEAILAEIWSEVLQVKQVGIHDNFFERGGHSLKATQLAAKVFKAFHVELPLREIFRLAILQDQAEAIRNAATKTYLAIDSAGMRDDYPLSSAQKRLFILAQRENSTTYNMPGVLLLPREIEPARLNAAFRQLIKRHAAFRTSFAVVNGEMVQIVHPEVDFALETIGLQDSAEGGKTQNPQRTGDSHQPEGNLQAEIQRLLQEFVRPFDLALAPLLRVSIIYTPENAVLLYDMHHIISDGRSMEILVAELLSLYAGEQLPPLALQYVDFAIWQDQFLRSERLQIAEEYWLAQFAEGVPILELPTDYPRPAVMDYAGDRYHFTLDAEIAGQIRSMAREKNASLYMVLLAVYTVLLAKYSGQEEIVIGTPVAGRPHADLEKVIGMFVNTLALRNRVEGKKTFHELLTTVRENSLQAFEHQDYQLEMLIEKLDTGSDLSRNPLFDTLFTVQNLVSQLDSGVSKHTAPFMAVNPIAKFDLTLQVIETGAELNCNLEYRVNLFKRASMERLAAHFTQIVKEIVATPEKPVAEIEMLTSAEREQILWEFNATQVDYPREQTITSLFEAQVQRTPDHLAVVAAEISLTYRELNARANQLARLLRAKGVQADKAVGVIAERSCEMLIGVLAIVKAGGAYLPIDMDYPEERIRYMLADADVEILLTDRELTVPGDFAGELLNCAGGAIYHEYEKTNLETINTAHDLLYIIYTSGSTGQPKGVMIEHCNVNRLISHSNLLILDSTDRILQTGSLAFDASTFEIWGSFLNGATLYLVPREILLSGSTFVETIHRYEITTVFLTTALFNQLLEEEPEVFTSLRMLLVGGEVASPRHFNQVWRRTKELNFHHVYGPTESTTFATSLKVDQEYTGSVPIGQPLANTQVYILDHYGKLQPVGVVGELCIGGDGLARGYLNEPGLTAEKFITSPIVRRERLYRTGDLAKWHPDGTIEFVGRIDHQVKIRGYRIELGEIETQLLSHPAVTEAIVLVKTDGAGQKYLCAYLVTETELTTAELRSYLLQKLPDYMLPKFFVKLAKMPLTINGKIDRKALPVPEETEGFRKEYAAPVDETEERLAQIWSEVLQLERVGRTDNFFELGGHSLKATQLASQVFKEFQIELPLREIFQRDTLMEQAAYLQEAAVTAYSTIEPVEEKEYYPLSSAQKRLFILHQLNSEGLNYNMPEALVMEHDVSVELLQKVLTRLIQRHEAFRTSFKQVNGVPVQQIHSEVVFQIEEIEVERDELPQTIHNWIRPFDLSQAPLFRVGLVKSHDQCLLIFDQHHIISDGQSIGILLREFKQLVEGVELPPLKIQYKDFAVWQNHFLSSDACEKQKEYWLEQFAQGVPVLNLATDFPRPTIMEYAGDRIHFAAGKELTAQLKQLAGRHRATLYMTLLAAWNVLLSKYTGQEDIIVGSAVAGRNHADLEGVLGMFVNTLAMRNYPAAEKTFHEFLVEVKERALKNFQNQHYQFEMLIEQLGLQRDLSRNPLVEVSFTLQNLGITPVANASSHKLEAKTVKSDLALIGVEDGEEIRFILEYRTSLFTALTIERMTRHFLNILMEITTQPELPISGIQMLSSEEKWQLITGYNGAETNIPEKTLHQLVEEQVEQTPEAIAVVARGQRLTYAEINAAANRLARHLSEQGVQPEEIVALIADRSLEAFIGILAILKAGGAYLPIDPEYPPERIRYILEDSGCSLLLTQQHLWESITFGGKTVVIDPALTGDASNLPLRSRPDHLAYVIYTSGSTGNPKGVMVEHRSAVNLITWFKQEYDLQIHKHLLLLVSFTFDPSVEQIFSALTAGATIYCIEKELMANREQFRRFIEENRIGIFSFVPSALRELLADGEKIPSLEVVISGGENLHETVKTALLDKGYRLSNHYGPTETTVDALTSRCSAGRVTLGRPIPNVRCYILDQQQNPVPVGVMGELYIAGAGLARGYLNRPDLTAERFVPDPYYSGNRMYKTGDIVRWLPDGQVEFFGRQDDQVKIRGFRIELKEIEYHLLQHSAIREAVVVSLTDGRGMNDLTAYYCAEQEIPASEVRQHLATCLPEYMIPSFFVQLASLPNLPNGKVDKQVLPKPEGLLQQHREHVAPETAVEEQLALLWTEVLGMERIGVTDHFFELGGHSLKATNLVTRIYEEFGVELSLLTLFQNPTVRGLAQEMEKILHAEERIGELSYAHGLAGTTQSVREVIEEKQPKLAQKDRNLVLLRRGANRERHLFIIHDGSGDVEAYLGFAAQMNPDFSYWGVRGDRIHNYTPVNRTIEAIATQYVAAIRQVQITGPYHIAGWCIGGTIAFEIVRILEAMGEEIRFFGMIDSIAPDRELWGKVKEFSVKTEAELLEKYGADKQLRKSVKKLKTLEEVWPHVLEHLDRVGLNVQQFKDSFPYGLVGAIPDFERANLAHLFYYQNMIRTFAQARALYVPANRIHTRIQFFQAEETHIPNRDLWKQYSSKEMNTYIVRGDHYSIFTNPEHLQEFAQVFNRVLIALSKKGS